ncbi:hypothetical protein jhhlp_005658 [Lomentospora prolificans]|uniref:cystathionine gamma-synthase n=1 Tax=Lomentospora prolificans TaxID=41688 RepID=A0A2N3N3P8_9PEZI|nr:hypothetical protein jhhlp_005658 [Lomentospora prolificans]
MPSFELGAAIPPDTAHASFSVGTPLTLTILTQAVSVSLPTWKANVGYEEGEDSVISRLATGYPRYLETRHTRSLRRPLPYKTLLTSVCLMMDRFFIHKTIAAFAQEIVQNHGRSGQTALLFPTPSIARRCREFIRERCNAEDANNIVVLDLALAVDRTTSTLLASLAPTISAVIFENGLFSLAKAYWQHTGDGISSRRAEFCFELYKQELLVIASSPQAPSSPPYPKSCRAPRRYHRPLSGNGPVTHQTKSQRPQNRIPDEDPQEWSRFLEERFGRNLDLGLVERAKSAIKRRIAGAVTADADEFFSENLSMTSNSRGITGLEENDVYLFPCGMNAIFNVHHALRSLRKSLKSINFGFPYVDTLKILEKFGAGCIFYGHASTADLDDLERRLRAGERFLALFCEFPGNPLLTCPDLRRIRKLADDFDFFVVVDETIGTFANINVLQFADVVVSSLTKIFSGDCNVMGGCAILNPTGSHSAAIKASMEATFEDTYWPEDVVFLERNSRDFLSRVGRINSNSEAICDTLRSHPSVKRVYYPKYNESRPNYDVCKLPTGGYGGLLSVTFHSQHQAIAFYDALETAKGPSLGTNFTLTCPYVLIAHYQELDWAAKFGAETALIRVSVGLEETENLRRIFEDALNATSAVSTK